MVFLCVWMDFTFLMQIFQQIIRLNEIYLHNKIYGNKLYLLLSAEFVDQGI